MSQIVCGLGFGDEGKGLTTSFLCEQSQSMKSYGHRAFGMKRSPIVIRFNGGGQAGHTVVHNGERHVFSNFGSGTLQNVPTYWSHYCTFCPASLISEYNALRKIGAEPVLYVHPLCPVITPMDVLFNRSDTTHGSVGVGFGDTLQREADHYHLYAMDLAHPTVLRQKLEQILRYYRGKSTGWGDSIIQENEKFIERAQESLKYFEFNEGDILGSYSDHICEGAQGILLDQQFGFFPNVTRSHTTSKNAISILAGSNLVQDLDIYYVTRAYQTRHGNGFLSNEKEFAPPVLTDIENETNVKHEYQGEFRKAILDIDMLKYALRCDTLFTSVVRDVKRHLVITCVDQTGPTILVTEGGVEKEVYVSKLHYLLNDPSNYWRSVHLAYGPSAQDVKCEMNIGRGYFVKG